MSYEPLSNYGLFDEELGTLELGKQGQDLLLRIEAVVMDSISVKKQFNYPSLIHESVLKNTGYLDNFPHQLLSLAREQGSSGKSYLRPAACLQWYEQFNNQNLKKSQKAVVISPCFRHETKPAPWRLTCFRMIELVTIIHEATISEQLEEMEKVARKVYSALELPITAKQATDAFFLGQDSGSKMMQQLEQLKMEYCYMGKDYSFALASKNNHKNYFTQRYNISIGNEPTYSACLAFGVERLLVATILEHGVHLPKALQ